MATLTIDGIEVSVDRGATILEAAQKAGVRIPTLCHDKRLIPYGSCRLCMVEVTARGRTRTMPACFNPARDGMQVATHTPKLIESRRTQLMLLLRSHPLLCPSCDAAGNCRLQDLVHEYKIGDLPFETESRYFHLDNASHFIRFNMNLCIKCGMCVRICDEVQGVNELSFIERGLRSEVSTDFGRPLDCEFCGQCAQVCPVGAISSKWLVGTGREFELKRDSTVCAFCSLGCVLTVGKKDGKIVWVSSPSDSHNEGNLCVKGRYGWPYVYSSERLDRPLIRRGTDLAEAGWDEAIGFVAQGFGRAKAAVGGEGLAVLGSQRLTNEDAYLLQRLARTVLETPHVDHAGGYGYKGLVEGLMPAFGFPASTNPISDIRRADVILLLGADLAETHPVAKNEVILATGRRRAQAIVIDCVKTSLTKRPGLQLIVPPGAESLVGFSMIKEIIDQGLHDKAISADGLDELIASLAPYGAEQVAAVVGIDASLIRQAARLFAKARSAVVVLTEGGLRAGGAELRAKAASNLALITGHIGKPGSGVCVFGEKTNAQGAIDMGLIPSLLPGYSLVSDDGARAKFENAWGAPLPAGPGRGTEEILAGARNGEIKALYVVGENPVETYPDRTGVEAALKRVDFLVVQDMFLTSTARLAHAVLPVASFLEKAGTFTSAEGLVQRIRPLLPLNGTKPDTEIFCALAAAMGRSFSYQGPESVTNEIAGLAQGYSGINADACGQNGAFRTLEGASADCAGRLYERGFPGGKPRYQPAPPLPKSDAYSGKGYHLIPSIQKFHSGSMSQWSPSLMEVRPEGYAEMCFGDMREQGFEDGDFIRVTTEDGVSIRMRVKASRRACSRTIIVPQHFSALKLNLLTKWGFPPLRVKVEKG
jgi:formate dehydrogenase alpha subunit